MDIAKVILEYIQTLVWPVVVGAFAWHLRGQLRTIATNLAERVKLLTDAEIGPAKLRFDTAAETVKSAVGLANTASRWSVADEDLIGAGRAGTV